MGVAALINHKFICNGSNVAYMTTDAQEGTKQFPALLGSVKAGETIGSDLLLNDFLEVFETINVDP
ncbi:hypothetical protein E2562_027291 [Oryza meyeriana var. granulata]|uniref:Uncharacterized protein n=1 Tax=Oryza meyeriana var. granulata TaxID=110450 RepID=A0A6G1C9J3_9ORYZ|nr:hypothetical protein E2562_027291 [Oryza meyeriana var. granulata]